MSAAQLINATLTLSKYFPMMPRGAQSYWFMELMDDDFADSLIIKSGIGSHPKYERCMIWVEKQREMMQAKPLIAFGDSINLASRSRR